MDAHAAPHTYCRGLGSAVLVRPFFRPAPHRARWSGPDVELQVVAGCPFRRRANSADPLHRLRALGRVQPLLDGQSVCGQPPQRPHERLGALPGKADFHDNNPDSFGRRYRRGGVQYEPDTGPVPDPLETRQPGRLYRLRSVHPAACGRAVCGHFLLPLPWRGRHLFPR